MTNYNRGDPWTLDDIELLDILLRANIQLSDACKLLGRTKPATEHAVKKIIYQQLLEHTPDSIAERYNKDVNWITDELVDPKYRIYYETESEDEEDDDKIQEDEDDIVLKTSLSMFASTVVAGVAYYLFLLYSNTAKGIF